MRAVTLIKKIPKTFTVSGISFISYLSFIFPIKLPSLLSFLSSA